MAGCRTTLSTIGRRSSPLFEPGSTPYNPCGGWLCSISGATRSIEVCLREQVRRAEHYETISDVIGQKEYAEQAKFLESVDAVVFVVDSQKARLAANEYYLARLRRDLDTVSRDVDAIPVFLQINKRDLPDLVDVEVLANSLRTQRSKALATIATASTGIADLIDCLATNAHRAW